MKHLLRVMEEYGYNSSKQKAAFTELLKVYNLFDKEFERLQSPVEALEWLNCVLQKSFKRTPGTERQQLVDDVSEGREKMLDIMQQLNLIDDIDEYIPGAWLLVFGADEKDIISRLKIVEDLIKIYNLRYVNLVLLGGERDLWADHEPSTKLLLIKHLMQRLNMPKNEAEDVIQNFYNTHLSTKITATNNSTEIIKLREHMVNEFTKIYGEIWPTETDLMQSLTCYMQLEEKTHVTQQIVNAGKKVVGGKLLRPDGRDTVVQFWEDSAGEIESYYAHNKIPISLVGVTSQPYGEYQRQQMLDVLSNKPAICRMVARKINDISKFNIPEGLDTLARQVYAGKRRVTELLT